MAVIKVPRPPATAFNKNRQPSSLLTSQIRHLEWAVRPATQRKPHQLPKVSVKTEGQAAERIAELTRQLHPELAKPTSILPPTPVEPAARKKRGTGGAKRRRASAKRGRGQDG